MAPPACAACGQPLDPARRVCGNCGAVPVVPKEADDERQVVHEWHQALQHALSRAREDAKDGRQKVRERFLANALVPANPEVVIEQALQCEPMLSEDQPEAAIRHYEALLTKLDLLALEQPTLLRRIPIMRGKLTAVRARERAVNRNVVFGLVGCLGLIGVCMWLVGRACAG